MKVFCKRLVINNTYFPPTASLLKIKIQCNLVACQPADAHTGNVGAGVVQISQAVGEAEFGGEFEELEKLLEANTVLNRKIFVFSTEVAGSLKFFPAHVALDAKCSPRQQVHPRIVTPFRLVLEQHRKIDPGRFARFFSRTAAGVIIQHLPAIQRYGRG